MELMAIQCGLYFLAAIIYFKYLRNYYRKILK